MAFNGDNDRQKFMNKLGGVGNVYKQDRTFSSWSESGTVVGDDTSSQFGKSKVILQLKNPKNAKNMAFAYNGDRKEETLTTISPVG